MAAKTMKLAEKLELLRSMEGNLRGLNRPLSKSEIARLVEEESGEKISVAYLSQLETGKRPHMTETTRELLARFYKVHPGFFVSDPEGFDPNVTSVPLDENLLDSWLLSGARQFGGIDSELALALRRLADHDASRAMLLLSAELARDPELLALLRKCLDSRSRSAQPLTSGNVKTDGYPPETIKKSARPAAKPKPKAVTKTSKTKGKEKS